MRFSRRTCLAAAAAISFRGMVAADDSKQNAASTETAEVSTKATRLFNGTDLEGWKKASFGGDGAIEVQEGNLILGRGDTLTAVVCSQEVPKLNYELALEAQRLEGIDFFCGATFPVADSHCSFIVGGWAGGIVGLSSINGRDALENETTLVRYFKNNQWYKFRVRVTEKRIRTWIDDEMIINVDTTGKRISTRVEVDECKPLGFATWQTKAALKEITLRKLTDEEIASQNG